MYVCNVRSYGEEKPHIIIIFIIVSYDIAHNLILVGEILASNYYVNRLTFITKKVNLQYVRI